MKYCTNCGIKTEDYVVFCGKCGEKFDDDTITEMPAEMSSLDNMPGQNEQPSVDVMPVNNDVDDIDKTIKKKSNKKFIPVIIGIIAIMAAVVVIFLLPKKSKTPAITKPEFSFEKGIDLSKIDNIAVQDGNGSYYKYETYNNDDEGDKLNLDDVDCIIGRNGNMCNVSGSYRMIGGRKSGVIKVSDDKVLSCICIRRYDEEERDNDIYGIELIFLDDFNYDGVTKSSSVSDIKKAGYKECTMNGAYFKVFSDKNVSWESLESDYKKIYESNVSNEEVMKEGYPVEYGKELKYCRWIFNDPLSNIERQRDYSIGKDYDHTFELWKENADINVDGFKREYDVGYDEYYKDSVPKEAAIAKQCYYLINGEIDYFAVVEIETHKERTDMAFSGGPAGMRNSLSGSKNVCHVYLFSDMETVAKWINGWGL